MQWMAIILISLNGTLEELYSGIANGRVPIVK